jgi:4-hydroxy-2-oxoheptanedioate aldolase
MVETAQQAQDLVAAIRYAPNGVRGVGSSLARAARWNMVPNYLETAGDQICLLVQVESRRGLDNLDSIAAVPGVDGVFIGPSDLAAALGHLGKPGVPEVQSAVEGGISRIRAAGKAAGILTMDESLNRRYLSQGCQFVAVGTDIALLLRAGRALAEQFKGRS